MSNLKLQELLNSLRTSNEVTYALRENKINSLLLKPDLKSLTISGASMIELEALRRRLDTEETVKRNIQRINAITDGVDPYGYEANRMPIPSNTPVSELVHFGVLGMRWGVKKGSSTSGSGAIKRPNKKLNSMNGLSDVELRNKINRIKLEKEYMQLTKKESSLAKKVLGEILGEAAKNTAKVYAQKYMMQGVNHLLKAADNS